MRAPWHGRSRISVRVYQAPAAGGAARPGGHRQPDAPLPLRLSWGDLDSAPDPYGPDPVVFGPPRGERGETGAGRAFGCCGVRGAGMTCWACAPDGRPG